jgi:hypothetical protein
MAWAIRSSTIACDLYLLVRTILQLAHYSLLTGSRIRGVLSRVEDYRNYDGRSRFCVSANKADQALTSCIFRHQCCLRCTYTYLFWVHARFVHVPQIATLAKYDVYISLKSQVLLVRRKKYTTFQEWFRLEGVQQSLGSGLSSDRWLYRFAPLISKDIWLSITEVTSDLALSKVKYKSREK